MAKNKENTGKTAMTDKKRIRKAMEGTATFGLLLIAVGLIGPFASGGMPSAGWATALKWIYAAGALIYAAARAVNVNEPGDGFRVRRLRRLEFWGGIAFCIAAAFWFYKASKLGGSIFTFQMLHETILFTLVGALIQIVASWLLVSAIRKQRENPDAKK